MTAALLYILSVFFLWSTVCILVTKKTSQFEIRQRLFLEKMAQSCRILRISFFEVARLDDTCSQIWRSAASSSRCKSPLSHLQAILDFRSSHILDSVHSPNFLQRPKKKKKIAKITFGLRNNVVIFLIPNCSIWNLFQTAFLLAPSFAQVPKNKNISINYSLLLREKLFAKMWKKIDHFPSHFYSELGLVAFFSNSFFFVQFA